MLRVVTDDDACAEMRSSLDEIVLEVAWRMREAASEAEVTRTSPGWSMSATSGVTGWW